MSRIWLRRWRGWRTAVAHLRHRHLPVAVGVLRRVADADVGGAEADVRGPATATPTGPVVGAAASTACSAGATAATATRPGVRRSGGTTVTPAGECPGSSSRTLARGRAPEAGTAPFKEGTTASATLTFTLLTGGRAPGGAVVVGTTAAVPTRASFCPELAPPAPPPPPATSAGVT